MKTTLHFSIVFSLSLLAAPAAEEFFEVLPNGSNVPPPASARTATNFSNIAAQPSGALSGRIVYCGAGHGWTWGKNGWFTQRGIAHEMNEDCGNLDQLNHFVPYLFNAGATVVPTRPIGQQTNEVVLDNDSPGVKFSGGWWKSASTVFYGSAGDVPYQFAPVAPAETATADYMPRIPVAGFYPVYTWARHGPDRTWQLYRIFHTGGETQVRIPHHMVGDGWVYLGTYFFNAGNHPANGSVRISNLQPEPAVGHVVIADAIRFGNGMGDFIPAQGASPSSYPREDEGCRYWIARGLGQGQSTDIYDGSGEDQSDNVGAPIRLAKVMNRENEGRFYQRIYISFHSNAGGGRGAVALWNNPKLFPGTQTPHQERLAELMGREINDTLSALASPPLEVPWFNRSNRITFARSDYAFGEINNRYIGDEFDATMAEVAFHDHPEDAKLLRDPKVRNLVGRCAYQAVVRYMNEFDQAPLQFLPEPPPNVRVVATDHGFVLAWDKPVDSGKNAPTEYVIYRSQDGYGFGQPVRVIGEKTSVTISDPQPNTTSYFRVTAVNGGGESLPSVVVGGRRATSSGAPKILFVQGFTELSRRNNPRQSLGRTNYTPWQAFGAMDRVIPIRNNSLDAVVRHGQALAAQGAALDSCSRAAVSNGAISLREYAVVIWAAGNQTTSVLTPTEQAALTKYRSQGGHIFISGAHLAEDLHTRFDATSRRFLQEQLGAFYLGNVTNAAKMKLQRTGFFHFWPRRETFGHGVDSHYFSGYTDALSPCGDDGKILRRYAGEETVAALGNIGTAGEGRLVYLAVPFETLDSTAGRRQFMGEILRFLGRPRITPVPSNPAAAEWKMARTSLLQR